MSKIIGIDLGTTNSCVSVLEAGKPIIIPNKEGQRTTPSVVAYKDGDRLIGENAKRQAVTNKETVFSVKSKIGYNTKISLNGEEYSPQEISAMILQELKKQAEEYLGEEVTKAVITVPAYFNDSQRQATKDAGRIAGLKVEKIVNEPTAAALAYGLNKLEDKQNILVYDFGGGTFDVSVLEMYDGFFEVKATAGSNNLGGDDIDEILINHILDYFYDLHEVALRDKNEAMGRIQEAAEIAKRDLSTLMVTTINLPFLTFKDGAPLHLEIDITREKFEELIYPLINKTIEPVERAIKDSSLNKKEIDKVLLVGGTTRIPAVRELVENITGKSPHKDINPDEAVSLGAAIQGGILSGEVNGLTLIDVTPLSLGIETAGGIMTKLIDRNTTIPATSSQVFSTATDGQESVSINVYQGERALAKDNHLLGTFTLTGIPEAKKGVPKIEVTFTIDVNGLVSVKAKDQKTGRSQKVIIEASGGLTQEDIARMIVEAENYQKEDKDLKLLVQVRNDFNRMKEQFNNNKKDFIDTLPESEVEDLMAKFNQVEIGINQKRYDILKFLGESLSEMFGQKLVKVYKDSSN